MFGQATDHADFLGDLYGRWQDEKEYEDFNDYVGVMKKMILARSPKMTTFVRGSKRPFGITIQIPGFPYKVQVVVGSRHVGWQAVK